MWPIILTHVDAEDLFKVTGSHVHCRSGNVLEIVQSKDVVTADHQ